MIINYLFVFPAGQTVSSSTPTSTSSSSSSQTSSSTSFSFSTSGPSLPPTAPAQSESSSGEPQDLAPDLRQLLGSLLGAAGGPGGATAGAPSITVTTSSVPAFIQGMTEFMQQVGGFLLLGSAGDVPVLTLCFFFQASQPIFSPPPPPSAGPTAGANPAAAAAESVNPELFTGIMRGVLSTMMGSLGQAQNDTESIAQFMQRLSQATNLFNGQEDPTGRLPAAASALHVAHCPDDESI